MAICIVYLFGNYVWSEADCRILAKHFEFIVLSAATSDL